MTLLEIFMAQKLNIFIFNMGDRQSVRVCDSMMDHEIVSTYVGNFVDIVIGNSGCYP